MIFLDLPTEVCTLIFTFLDTKSKINVYVINELKPLFASHLVSEMDLSRSTIATAKTLSHSIFQDMAVYILELNLSAIKDLTANQLAPFMQRCNNLITLDVTFTRIFLCDLQEICCDSLKNIGINFFKTHFFKPSVEFDILRRGGPYKDKAWILISELFKKQKFERVHFILFEFNQSEFPLKFMEDKPLTKDLKITLADHCGYCSSMSTEEYNPFINMAVSYYINFKNLSYDFKYIQETSHHPSHMLGGISNLNYTQTEYLFIMNCKGIVHIYVSQKISKIFDINCCCNLSINVCSHLSLNIQVTGKIVFRAWNRNLTDFSDEFFNELLCELTDYFPTYVCMHTKTKTRITNAPSYWYFIDSCDTCDGILENIPKNVTLTDFCRRGYMPEWSSSITQKLELGLFKNITFLSIREVFLKDDFFAHIFSKCELLHTLDVSIQNCEPMGLGSECMMSLFNSLYQIRLKNLRFKLRDVDYHNIFNSLSKCPTLENIHMCDRDHRNKYVPSNKEVFMFLEKCCNLYSLFIEAEMEEDIRETLEYRLTSEAKKLDRDHLGITVCYYGCNWNPFTDLFNPSPLDITE